VAIHVLTWDNLQTSSCFSEHSRNCYDDIKQNEGGIYFSSMDPMKVPVHKFQSHFMICVREFVLTQSMSK
jgi:hypothetical protein